MDHRELQKLVELMNENELVELEIEEEGFRVTLRKAQPATFATGPTFLPPAPAPAPPPPASAAASPSAPQGPPPGTRDIVSPMVGTFYRRPSPDAAPYVNVGDPVHAETVVCIVEAMKVNNEIKAEFEGEILEVLVEDGEAVEYDQPLFRVKVR
jgi:acetyl-CoA carboxylase biotin carboxyl carrier protein